MAVGLLAVAGLSNPAWAAVSVIDEMPRGTLSFDTPSGNVGPMDSIPVMLTLTLDEDSVTFHGPRIADFDDFVGVLPDGFNVSFAYIQSSFTHGGTLSTNGISGPPYKFSFSDDELLGNVTLQPGESVSFKFGSFTPSNGPVAPGTYFGNRLSINYAFIDETQEDPGAEPGSTNTWQTDLPIASTCNNCFQRTVVAAIPEPETYAMLLAGLGLMGWVVRRRTRA